MTHLLLAIIYLAFVSLGLPDALLGAAWPTMYPQFTVPVSYMGIVSMIIAFGTVVSSLQSDRLTRKFGTGRVTAVSVLATAVALFGFSISHSFVPLCLWAIPYGLGAGSVDASINNYVALHYASRHMSWLHCMWGIGAALGPYILGVALTGGQSWNMGYRYIALMQFVLTAILLISLPLWQKNAEKNAEAAAIAADTKPLSLREVMRIPGAKHIMLAFLCYCAIEQTTGQWASSYLVLHKGVSTELAASFASLFYIGITVGRVVCGFLTIKLSDTQMIRLGQGLLLVGVLALFFPLGQTLSIASFLLIGLGCAPIYPCIIHSTPAHFGAARSQAIIGVQMASAYVGCCAMPPLFGVIASHTHIKVLPVYLLVLLVLMVVVHERLVSGKRRELGNA